MELIDGLRDLECHVCFFVGPQTTMSEMSTAACIEQRDFETAKELVDFIRPSSENWEPLIEHAVGWVFRGQRNAKWPLIPAAWRADAKPILQPIMDRLRGDVAPMFQKWDETNDLGCPLERAVEHRSHVEAEQYLAHQFLQLADELGHPVPDKGSVELRMRCCPYRSTSGVFGPQPNTALALAQHHRVPTRLLDWTRKSMVAAFFAADGAESGSSLDDMATHIAIWALNLNVTIPGLRRLTCPRHQFQFLHAQDGLFTYLDNAGDFHFIDSGSWPTIEEYLSRLEPRPPSPVLRKMTLPTDEAGSLLQLLWRERISSAHLMPTYDNVTAAIFRKLRWSAAGE